MEKQQPPPYSAEGYPPAPGPPYPTQGYPPGPGIYPNLQNPQGPPPTVVVHTTQAVLVLGPQPSTVTCPSCHATVTTSVRTEATTKTHLFALLLCLFGCWPCCCIPYCVDSCQSQNHYCPNCKAYLGKYDN